MLARKYLSIACSTLLIALHCSLQGVHFCLGRWLSLSCNQSKAELLGARSQFRMVLMRGLALISALARLHLNSSYLLLAVRGERCM